MDYSDREVVDVLLKDIRSGIDDDGQNVAIGTIVFEINSIYENAVQGPTLTAKTGVHYEAGASLEDIEQQLLAAAHGFAVRIANAGMEALQDVYRRERDDRLKPDPMAELQEELKKFDG